MEKSTWPRYKPNIDRSYGGDHRLFDGGHDLIGAFERAKEALPDDSPLQEIIGYKFVSFI